MSPGADDFRTELICEMETWTDGRALPPTVRLSVDAIVTARARLTEVRAALDRDGPVVIGSRKQPRPHPLLAAERQLERAISTERDRLAGAVARFVEQARRREWVQEMKAQDAGHDEKPPDAPQRSK